MLEMKTEKKTKIKIIPAIDLRGGQVVRLTRGDFAQEKVYSNAPEEVAQKWQSDGAELIHVVDLDGALTGKRKNLGSLKNICAVTTVPIQFGGGLRTIRAVEEVFATGVSRAVIGTKALDLKLLKDLVKRFNERIVVGLDIRDSQIQISGWKKAVKIVKLDSFCKEIDNLGVKHVVFTDVSRDGTLLGPNTESLIDLFGATKINVIVSGGVAETSDLIAIAKLKEKLPNIYGVIIGKALYEKRFTLPEAIRAAQC